MRSNFFHRLLILALALMMISLPATAENCTLCDKDAGGDYYLCADCMLALLDDSDLAGWLEITGAKANEDGSVALTWQDGGENGPYTVMYELLEAAPVPFGWTAAEGVSGHAFTLTQLVPGVHYVLTVADAAGHKAQTTYFAGDVEASERIGAQIGVITMLRKLPALMQMPFSAREIVKDNGWVNGLQVQLTYSMLIRTREYAFTLTVEAPNGFADTVLSGDITLNAGKSVVPAWTFVSLGDYFTRLNRYYGEIPTGEYAVTLNFDGKPACTASFLVQE